MSKLLLDEKPLIILPNLATLIGLNKSIVIQQLHYWLIDNGKFIDGRKWIYNTYEDWGKQFPFWSDKTIRRTITELENEGLLVTGNYNKLKADRTKWYSIDYQKLEILTSPCGQNDQSMWSNWPVASGQNDPSNTRDYTETTSDKQQQETNPFNFYEQNGFGTISSTIADKINAWIDDQSFKEPEQIIVLAMEEAVLNNVLRWSYVNKILENWYQQKLQTVQDIQAYRKSFDAKKSVKTSNKQSNLSALEEIKRKRGLTKNE